MPAAAGRMPAVPKTKKPNWTILHNKFPPTPRVGLVWRGRIAQLSFFFLRRSFFAATVAIGGHRPPLSPLALQPNEVDRTIFWLLAFRPALPDVPSSRLHPRKLRIRPMGSRIQLQQRNCSRFARDFLRRSTFSSSQRTASRSSGLRLALQDLFNQRATNFLCPRPMILPTSSSLAEPGLSAPISRSRCRRNFRTRGSR